MKDADAFDRRLDGVRPALIAPTAFGNFAQLMPSSFAAVPPRMAILSSSLRPGIDMT